MCINKIVSPDICCHKSQQSSLIIPESIFSVCIKINQLSSERERFVVLLLVKIDNINHNKSFYNYNYL